MRETERHRDRERERERGRERRGMKNMGDRRIKFIKLARRVKDG